MPYTSPLRCKKLSPSIGACQKRSRVERGSSTITNSPTWQERSSLAATKKPWLCWWLPTWATKEGWPGMLKSSVFPSKRKSTFITLFSLFEQLCVYKKLFGFPQIDQFPKRAKVSIRAEWAWCHSKTCVTDGVGIGSVEEENGGTSAILINL